MNDCVSTFKPSPYFVWWIGNKLAAFQKPNNMGLLRTPGLVAQSNSQGSIQSHAASKSNTHPGLPDPANGCSFRQPVPIMPVFCFVDWK